MKYPIGLEFEGLSIPVDALQIKKSTGPMHPTWTRVQFKVDDPYEDVTKVEDWLKENCSCKYELYSYTLPKSNEYHTNVIVRFEEKNEALMFKLKGGHQ